MPGRPSLSYLPKGYLGTRETIVNMKNLVDQAKKQESIIKLARKIVYKAPERDQRAEVDAIFRWVQQNVRFVNDPWGVETLTEPWHLINDEFPSEDCDGLSTLFNSLCAAAGYNTAFRTIKAERANPNEFTHVYSVVEINGKWVPADPSQKDRPLGWEPPRHYGMKQWGYATGKLTEKNLKGLGMPNKPVGIRSIVAAVVGNMGRRRAQASRPIAVKAPAQKPSAFLVVEDPEVFDPDNKGYYGDQYGSPGGYHRVPEEAVPESGGKPVATVYNLRRYGAPIQSMYGERMMDQKFPGRMSRASNEPPLASAIKDGTAPRIVPPLYPDRNKEY